MQTAEPKKTLTKRQSTGFLRSFFTSSPSTNETPREANESQQNESRETKKVLTLPENFADQVMELELELESNPTVDCHQVNKLIELYSAAVEFYASIGDNKYRVFKNKIVNLMTNRSVIEVISKPQADSSPHKSTTVVRPFHSIT
eukprot:TRINITY_DN165_c0_g1_i7.p1 TRINITY_DN165_c0_g1~~TRINITY_DN165_c0_g1_i7.p1  ORF type:complete len:145 (-),score=20.12 TRINITY_DN165_c0_g1_i7:358-792(-)